MHRHHEKWRQIVTWLHFCKAELHTASLLYALLSFAPSERPGRGPGPAVQGFHHACLGSRWLTRPALVSCHSQDPGDPASGPVRMLQASSWRQKVVQIAPSSQCVASCVARRLRLSVAIRISSLAGGGVLEAGSGQLAVIRMYGATGDDGPRSGFLQGQRGLCGIQRCIHARS